MRKSDIKVEGLVSFFTRTTKGGSLYGLIRRAVEDYHRLYIVRKTTPPIHQQSAQ